MLSRGALHAENFRRMDVLKRSIPEICFSFRNEQYPYGPVAQLGAHHIRIVGVVGSNPIRSTKSEKSELFPVGEGVGFFVLFSQ